MCVVTFELTGLRTGGGGGVEKGGTAIWLMASSLLQKDRAREREKIKGQILI